MSAHLSPMRIARLLTLEAGADERRGAEAHAASCASCRAELDAARAAQHRFQTQVAPRTLPSVVERHAARRRATRSRWLLAAAGGLALGAASLLLLLHLGEGEATCGTRSRPCLAYKGAPTLQLFAKRGADVFPVRDGQTLQPGDAVRFLVQAPAATHALIISVDAAGRVTVYHPYGGDRSAPLPALATVEIPGSIVLDDTLGPERIYVITSSRPIHVGEVAPELAALGARGSEAIRGQQSIDTPADTFQSSFLVEKRTAP